MAVALIQFWLAMPVALYGTLAILLLAYVGRYIPLGVRAANSSLRQIDPSLEESAQILGASWLVTMREVTLPLIRPGLFAGWLLVFVPVIQELSAPRSCCSRRARSRSRSRSTISTRPATSSRWRRSPSSTW